MKILIGRDSNSSKLLLTAEGKTVMIEASDVPPTVGSQHCQLDIDGNTIKLRNLDINNYTYVNGHAIELKTIQSTDQISLGVDKYPLLWNYVEQLLPPMADIRHLREVWNSYEQQNIDLQIAERRFNTLRSVTGLITMAAIALSIVTGGRSHWYVALYAVAIAVSLLFFIKAYRDAAKIPHKRQELTRQFQRDYCCPHCGHNLGSQSYEILIQNATCPYCKTKFLH